MEPKDTPESTDDLIAALADGELDLRGRPDLLARLTQDAQTTRQVAYQQQLKQACAKVMDTPETRCPADLAAKLSAMPVEQDDRSAVTAAPATSGGGSASGSPVLARIGQWVPAAIAAVLLIAATVVFTQAGNGGASSAGVASLLSAGQVAQFDTRHSDCAVKPEILKRHNDFGEATDFEQLPGKLGEYFQTSTDGMSLNLSGVGYDYQLTGVCNLPGNGAVHIVYRHHDDPSRAISLWVKPDDGGLDKLEPNRVYVEAGETLDRPVIVWRKTGLIYYLVGDSLQDAHEAVDALRDPA